MAFAPLKAAGIEVAVLSGRRSLALQRRCEELGISHLHQGLEDKAAGFSRLTVGSAWRPGSVPTWAMMRLTFRS